jgi:hypothetical protein
MRFQLQRAVEAEEAIKIDAAQVGEWPARSFEPVCFLV